MTKLDAERLRFRDRPWKDMVAVAALPVLLFGAAVFLVRNWVNPAPANHLVITTSESEGDYHAFAKLYQDILKQDGVTLEIQSSSGAAENLKRLADEKSDADVGFVQDGLGSPEEQPNLESLGSLYYEPIWIFYRGAAKWDRLVQLVGKRVAVGKMGGGTRSLSLKLLKASGVDESNTKLVALGWDDAAKALRAGEVDAAIFLATPEDAQIQNLALDRGLRLMSLDQAEAITRQMPYLHHLVLPKGTFDLKAGIPAADVDLVSPTATLLVKDSLHPALIYLLLKAASQIHDDPGIFEQKNEFPKDKDYQFALSDEAKRFYKSGTPFWQRYLPFWLAVLVDRFILILIPLLALTLPFIRTIPKVYQWRIRSRIYQRYGELKYIETQLRNEKNRERYSKYLVDLDAIENRVNHLKVPLDFTDHLYELRGHIHFVRERLREKLAADV